MEVLRTPLPNLFGLPLSARLESENQVIDADNITEFNSFLFVWRAHPSQLVDFIKTVVMTNIDLRLVTRYSFDTLLNLRVYFFLSALVVRYLTRRFIWEYDPTLGKSVLNFSFESQISGLARVS